MLTRTVMADSSPLRGLAQINISADNVVAGRDW